MIASVAQHPFVIEHTAVDDLGGGEHLAERWDRAKLELGEVGNATEWAIRRASSLVAATGAPCKNSTGPLDRCSWEDLAAFAEEGRRSASTRSRGHKQNHLAEAAEGTATSTITSRWMPQVRARNVALAERSMC